MSHWGDSPHSWSLATSALGRFAPPPREHEPNRKPASRRVSLNHTWTSGIFFGFFKPREGFGTPRAWSSGGEEAQNPIAPVRCGLVCRDRTDGLGPVVPRYVCRRELMKPSCNAGHLSRRKWALTQADILFCAMPIVFFLSIVSFV